MLHSKYVIKFFSLMKCDKHCLTQSYCALRRMLLISGHIALNPGPVTQDNTLQLVSPIPWMILMQSRLAQLGLQSIDVGGALDSFFRSVSHQLYGDSNYHMHKIDYQPQGR